MNSPQAKLETAIKKQEPFARQSEKICAVRRQKNAQHAHEQQYFSNRTSWGVSGALYLQPATAGMNPGPRSFSVSFVTGKWC
jgi:hypothetical protein